jgi:hypothetical protein
LKTDWKWIRIHDGYHELKELGQFGDSFNEIISRLLLNQQGWPNGPTVLDRDQVKARLKKFDRHTKAISRLVRENISYTTSGNGTQNRETAT